MISRVVNQLRHLLQADLGRTVAKHEQHAIDDIGFAAAVGPNNRCEALVEGADLALAKVRLEVLKREVADVQSVLRLHRDGSRRAQRRRASILCSNLLPLF